MWVGRAGGGDQIYLLAGELGGSEGCAGSWVAGERCGDRGKVPACTVWAPHRVVGCLSPLCTPSGADSSFPPAGAPTSVAAVVVSLSPRAQPSVCSVAVDTQNSWRD